MAVFVHRPRVLTIGTFDGFHHGHARLLAACSRLGDLHVGVNTGRFCATYKTEPAQTWAERAAVLRELPFVAAVYENDGPGRDLIEQVGPDVLAAGSDWHGRYLEQIGCSQEWLDQQRIGVLYLPRTAGVSSSERRSES